MLCSDSSNKGLNVLLIRDRNAPWLIEIAENSSLKQY